MMTREGFYILVAVVAQLLAVGLFLFGQSWERRGNRYGVWCQILALGGVLLGLGYVVAYLLSLVARTLPAGGLR